ncbi:MAG: M28 family peptidase, partial [Clostridia bacterium]|nr:M28 family peptidase [Clostridia bacterium]
MNRTDLYNKSIAYLKVLCTDITDRSVGSKGNREATQFFKKELGYLGWKTETPKFRAMDWNDGGAILKSNGLDFKVLVSPYSLGCSVQSQLADATNISDLEIGIFKDKIIFLHGEIAREQLMPKKFVFYNPEEHQKIVALLENSKALAIICATSRNSALAGGVYPFPLIEDGDFEIPTVYMTEEEGKRLIPLIGRQVALQSISERIPGMGCNVIGRKGDKTAERIVVTAHIDAKKGTPGAIDNATGIIILLLLAKLLEDYSGINQIEIVAFNGEDYFAVPGQMNYVMANHDKFDNIIININIDGAGYKNGKSAFSFFGLPEEMQEKAIEVLEKYPGIVEGAPWPQGDHSIFTQQGRPAIAASSHWFTENINNQEI